MPTRPEGQRTQRQPVRERSRAASTSKGRVRPNPRRATLRSRVGRTAGVEGTSLDDRPYPRLSRLRRTLAGLSVPAGCSKKPSRCRVRPARFGRSGTHPDWRTPPPQSSEHCNWIQARSAIRLRMVSHYGSLRSFLGHAETPCHGNALRAADPSSTNPIRLRPFAVSCIGVPSAGWNSSWTRPAASCDSHRWNARSHPRASAASASGAFSSVSPPSSVSRASVGQIPRHERGASSVPPQP